MIVDKTAFFISDIHLGLGDKATDELKEQKLVALLKSIKNEKNCTLYILGDMFDYWFEYKYVIQKGYFEVFATLKELTSNGIEVIYLIGNHDFLHKDFFEKYIGVKVIFTETEATINGKKFFLGHGDGLVKNDTGYKILKKFLRNRVVQFLFYLIHPDFGVWLGKNTSKTSRTYTGQKNYGEIDGLFETAKTKIDEGFDYVLFGHSHQKASKEYKQGHYINLGSWMESPCYGQFKNNNFEIKDW